MSDWETLDRDFFKPPFLARMLERAGRYTDGLDDKDVFLRWTLEAFETLSEAIKTSQDVISAWDRALTAAALRRQRWLVHYGSALEHTKWVKGTRLGRES